MITQESAAQLLETHVQKGGRLAAAAHASIPSLKALLDTCLGQDIPAVLGPCGSGG